MSKTRPIARQPNGPPSAGRKGAINPFTARRLNHPTLANYAVFTRQHKRRWLRRIASIAALSFEAAFGIGLVAVLILATK